MLDELIRSEVATAVSHVADTIAVRVAAAVAIELARAPGGGDPDMMLDAEQAAAMLGMTVPALRRAAERGTAPVAPIRLGRRLRWRRGDLLAAAGGVARGRR